ncbi:hypothetical protein [Paenibacillus sp. Soil766]|uniref:hypothetical protein n=1 Tax=Paenibacillus sp. Soil766 TaxID=1736404 RepID=UPI0012FBCDB1|nr:hypothetical protein [Paenibacillus sp. Soil766]
MSSDKDECETPHIYVTNDFLPQFIDANSFVLVVVSLNASIPIQYSAFKCGFSTA